MMIRPLSAIVLGCAAALLSGCSDERSVSGSCRTGELSDKSVLCIDYYDSGKVSQWRMACNTGMKGEWSPAGCDTAKYLGGCKAGNKVIWYFPSERHKTVADVKQSCAGKDRAFVAAPGG
ncbi:MAG: hypothetical protein PVJ39_09345 [Gammaproteobacteria bacterium]|jgi:hypothetical protein